MKNIILSGIYIFAADRDIYIESRVSEVIAKSCRKVVFKGENILVFADKRRRKACAYMSKKKE